MMLHCIERQITESPQKIFSEMSRAESLLVIGPALQRFGRAADWISSVLLNNRILFATHEEEISEKDIKELYERLLERYDGRPSGVEILFEAYSDERLRQVPDAGMDEMIAAMEVIVSKPDKVEDIWNACHDFWDYLDDFWKWLDTQSKDAFGVWGAKFFLGEFQDDTEEEFSRFCRQFASEFDATTLASRELPEVDERSFSIRCGERSPCVLGNTKQFRLLQALVANVGRYVSWIDLATSMGGDDHDADSLPAVKIRLVRRLKECGYTDLADSIASQPQHYGLILE